MTNKRVLIALICVLMLAIASFSACGIIGRGGADASKKENHNTGKIISDTQAMDIVLERVPGASAEDFKRFEKELDDGHWIYEGEIVYKGIEYEFEIEACNGNILEWTMDN